MRRRFAARRSRSRSYAKRWLRWTPGLAQLASYQPQWLMADVLAGLVLAAVAVPVGVAYAVAAGLEGVYGLYATIVPFIVYAIFGPSRHMVIAPGSALIGIILVVVMNASNSDPAYAIMLASLMALVSGVVCILAGLARLGFITELLSQPIRTGFINGIAVTVMASQLPGLFGIASDGDNAITQIIHFVTALFAGHAHFVESLIGVGILLFMLFWPRRLVPVEFLAVVLATVVGAVFRLDKYGVALLGTLPAGLPTLEIPIVEFSDLTAVFMGGLAAAVFSLSSGSVLSRSFAKEGQGGRDLANKEMVALGASNLITGLFQGFPVAASTSRTPIIIASGAKTQLTALVAAAVIVVLISLAPGLLKSLPESALAAVVVVVSYSIMQFEPLKRMYRLERGEFWLSVSCFVGVIILGTVQGIGLAIFIAMVQFLWRAWRPHYAILGRVKGLKGYHDLTRYPDARVQAGLLLFRWDAPLFFANAEWFRDLVLEAIDNASTRTQWLVVASDPITNVDLTAADMLLELDKALQEREVRLCFASMKDPVKDQLKRFGLYEHFGEDTFYPTLGQAVSQYRRAQARRRALKEAEEAQADESLSQESLPQSDAPSV